MSRLAHVAHKHTPVLCPQAAWPLALSRPWAADAGGGLGAQLRGVYKSVAGGAAANTPLFI